MMKKKDYEVIVIGSGPLGIATARRLAEDGLQVNVLEAGTAISDPIGSHYRNQPRFQEDPDSFFDAIDPFLDPIRGNAHSALPDVTDSTLIGGQGILWTNNCPRAAVFERWPAMTPEQWRQRYSEAENLLQVLADPTERSKSALGISHRLRDPLAGDGRSLRGLPFSGRLLPEGNIHFNSPWDILAAAPAAVRQRITIETGVRVTRLHYSGRRVTGVELDRGGEQQRRGASIVLLAGGAVATPRLLYLSGIRPPALGRGFSFHALLFGQLILDNEICPPAGESDLPPRQWIPPTLSAPWHIQVLRDTCPLEPAEAVANAHRLLEFQAFWPVMSREENEVSFADDGRMAFQFTFSAADREQMAAMQADVERLAGRLGRWRDGCEPIWLPHGSAHLAGTCRMDLDDKKGVTDSAGRVHGFDNLYLATAGLFPRPVAVNPTLTAAALAMSTCATIAAGNNATS